MSPLTLTFALCAAAALSLCVAIAGGLFTLWCVYVTRTGSKPMPDVPIPTFIRKRFQDDDEEEETNGQPATARRVGP